MYKLYNNFLNQSTNRQNFRERKIDSAFIVEEKEMEVTVTQIKQLTLSLESNSTSGERLAALEDLQHIVKKQNMVMLVGQYALEAILQFLRQQQATVEEHQEALDLIYRLLNSQFNFICIKYYYTAISD